MKNFFIKSFIFIFSATYLVSCGRNYDKDPEIYIENKSNVIVIFAVEDNVKVLDVKIGNENCYPALLKPTYTRYEWVDYELDVIQRRSEVAVKQDTEALEKMNPTNWNALKTREEKSISYKCVRKSLLDTTTVNRLKIVTTKAKYDITLNDSGMWRGSEN